MNKLWKLLTIYDKMLIVFLITASAGAIIFSFSGLLTGGNNEQGDMVIVIQSISGGIQRIPVENTYRQQPLLIEVEGPVGVSIIEAHRGNVRLKEAPPDDPEKICEKTGWIDQPGPVIVCVPNKISIWLEAKGSDLDGVSW
ncbi:MAG: NusG domain II-containing protein [Halanaerobiaceae bacterium]